MRALVVLFAIAAVSSAASIMTMDDKEFEKAMMDQMFSQGALHPMMSIGALMATHHQEHQEPEAVEADVEPAGDRDATETEAADDQKETGSVEEVPRPPLNMFANGMMAMVFPDMMTGAIPYATNQPTKKPPGINNNGHGPSSGKRGGGSAAAASAQSFSRGPNAASSSQAQAFSGGFNQGS